MQLGFVRLCRAAGMLVFVGACENIQGMTETLTTTGPVTQTTTPPQVAFDSTGTKTTCTVTAARQDQFGLFQVAYGCAWVQANWVASGAVNVRAAGPQDAYRVMLREGLGLVRGNCADFFRQRGDNQQVINLSRDIVAMGGTTAAAIIGLTGGSALALSIIAISGATLYAGIDTYTKNFLFGVDNIESVRTLTMQTLNTNASTLLNVPDSEVLTFQNVAGAIMDNQEICKPASIAAAVRLKLRGGSGGIEAAGEDANARSQLDAARSMTIAARLGLPGGSVIDDTRLAAACWATTPDGMLPENLAIITKWLPRNPYSYGPDNPTTWPGTSARVATECQALSSTTQGVIKAKIAELRPKAAVPAESPPPPPPPHPPLMSGGPPPPTIVVVQPAPPPARVPRADGPIGPRYVPMRVN